MLNRVILGIVALSATIAIGAATSQINDYVDGNVLTGSELNSEFGNLYSTINSIDEGNLGSSVDFPGSSLAPAVAGAGLGKDGSENLEVKVDGTTIQISGDTLQIGTLATGSVTTTEILNSTILSEDVSNGTLIGDDMADGGIGREKLSVRTTGTSVSDREVGLSADTGAAPLVYSSGASVDIPNNSITITSDGGPLFFTATGGSSTTGSYLECEDAGTDECTIELWRGGTKVYEYSMRSAASGVQRIPPGSFSFIDTPAAGTYTYKLRAVIPSADFFRILNIRLMGYEL